MFNLKYLATIKHYYDSTTIMFKTQKEAEQWLDENSRNYKAIVTIYDDNWEKIDSYVYKEGEK